MNQDNLNYLKSELRKINDHFELKDFDFVIQKSKKIIKNNREHMPFYNYLGLAYRQQGKLYLAENTFQEAHRINPNSLSIITNLASIYRHLENYSQSIKYFEIGYKKNPNDVNVLCNFANLKRELNDVKGSISFYEKAFKINNNLPIVLHNLAAAYQIIGEFKLSIKYLKLLIKNFPKLTKAHKMLSDVIDYNKDNTHQKEMLLKLKDNSYNDENKISLYFALAKSFEDQKKFNESFNYIKKGNDISKKILMKTEFSLKNEKDQFDNIKKIFKDINLNNNDNKNNRGKNLIFIVGLPRSGTTLTHQIIGSHSKVYGAGELTILSNLVKRIYENSDLMKIIKNNSEKSHEKIVNIADNYIEKLSYFKTEKKIVLDKSPLNFRFIGFIKIIFPNAKIIHCTRNLKDTALSIYKNIFDGFALPWSYDQNDIIKFISIYLDMMKYWNNKIPEFIYESNYEKLVNNQETQSKKLFKFCNLSWETDTLTFFNKKNPIKTASITQARGPVYKSSVNSIKRYTEHLSFFKELDKFED